jgi:dsDNA-specific endonuclease/ATPase MutS2
MSIRGEDVLSMLATAQTSSLLGSLPRDFHSLISTTAVEYEDAISTELGIDKVLLRGVFMGEAYPLEVDSDRFSELKTHLALELQRLEFASKQRLAKKLSKHIPALQELVRWTMELDFKLAIGKFCNHHTLVYASVQKELGVSFVKGRNLTLEGKVQPIDYVLGSGNLFPKNNARAVVITGANSGGKTTLLELILQAIILTHMGFGVPSESAECSLFEEVYYFGKSKGDDAGAFETLLKTFEGLSKSSKGRIILADEIEAITEPGAAAKILAGLLDWFKEDEKTLIAVVTHLGEDIKEHVGSGVRIDGIEATGLDSDLNLIVDRNPLLGKVAKSTPELIVERLSRISKKSVDRRFYDRILERFKN